MLAFEPITTTVVVVTCGAKAIAATAGVVTAVGGAIATIVKAIKK